MIPKCLYQIPVTLLRRSRIIQFIRQWKSFDAELVVEVLTKKATAGDTQKVHIIWRRESLVKTVANTIKTKELPKNTSGIVLRT